MKNNGRRASPALENAQRPSPVDLRCPAREPTDTTADTPRWHPAPRATPTTTTCPPRPGTPPPADPCDGPHAAPAHPAGRAPAPPGPAGPATGPPSAPLPAATPGPPMPPAAHPAAGSWSQRSPAPSESITPACHAANVAGRSFTRAWAIANRFIALLRDNRNAIPTSSARCPLTVERDPARTGRPSLPPPGRPPRGSTASRALSNMRSTITLSRRSSLTVRATGRRRRKAPGRGWWYRSAC